MTMPRIDPTADPGADTDGPQPDSRQGGPLAGVRVLDLTTARSGPTCVRQLVDFGAEAIHVHAPSASDLPGSDGWNLHRGTRSIMLDLRDPDAFAALLVLVDRADVLVENFRPAVKYRLGIGPEDMMSRNPRLIYASISGFGQDGPYAARPGVDQIAQGMSGLMSVTGPAGSGPWRTGIAVSDTAAGTFLTQGVLAALFARTKTGRGQWVRTSLLESAINFMDFQAARFLNEGDVPTQAGNDHPTLVPMGAYRTADGMINIAVMGDGFVRFCEAIEASELLVDSRYRTGADRVAHRHELSAAIASHLLTESSAHWITALEAADLACGPVLTVDEVFADPQVTHLGLVAEVAHPSQPESVRVLRHPVTMSDTPLAVRGGPPAPGAHTAEILAELSAD